MFEFFAGASPALGVWVFGVVVLGVALAYAAMRAGWLAPSERAALDANTLARQRDEDPQKVAASGVMTKSEPREVDKPASGADKPWERPGQLRQNPDWKEPKKPDLEKWKESETH
jgi:hypothetical protein